jgi:diketogulonate reductase-like aldo/keto reductase
MGHSVLPKSINKARIIENIDTFYWSIPEDLFSKLSEIEQESDKVLSQCFMLV